MSTKLDVDDIKQIFGDLSEAGNGFECPSAYVAVVLAWGMAQLDSMPGALAEYTSESAGELADLFTPAEAQVLQ